MPTSFFYPGDVVTILYCRHSDRHKDCVGVVAKVAGGYYTVYTKDKRDGQILVCSVQGKHLAKADVEIYLEQMQEEFSRQSLAKLDNPLASATSSDNIASKPKQFHTEFKPKEPALADSLIVTPEELGTHQVKEPIIVEKRINVISTHKPETTTEVIDLPIKIRVTISVEIVQDNG